MSQETSPLPTDVTDKRRADLVIPYRARKPLKNEVSSAMSSSMPIAAMFLRNKILAWASLFTTIQGYLNEPAQLASDSQPAWLSVLLAAVGIVTCYMDIIMPPRGPTMANAAREAAAAVTESITTSIVAAPTA
ncbi:uncharacterized protein SAPINGB_P005004 [Magnusiomyces paraingens]|uniref:Uncharacterized protein n=1 Tax=Magnusiomyces paraingens TaxID=2606893 RepID=A0A5E8C0D8_9ASCO|nr:uncharacterized protein SAPINGB_P005004 [Saprochaete ingens]VVT56360.1 unnamed protein product [Saprochaete ingens]